jgi:hypothetical protein
LQPQPAICNGRGRFVTISQKGDAAMPQEMDACAKAMKGKATNEFAL